MKPIHGIALSALFGLFCLGFAPPAQADGIVVEIDGWLTGEAAGEAVEAAAERGIPIAMIFTDYDTA